MVLCFCFCDYISYMSFCN
uniref:Uncharacterized protein n=1 Tax=Rhizophora mucronata TaxID=61149 RepID=A0A2P2JU10_RHIMU